MIIGISTARFNIKYALPILIGLMCLIFLIIGAGDIIEGFKQYHKDVIEHPVKHIISLIIG